MSTNIQNMMEKVSEDLGELVCTLGLKLSYPILGNLPWETRCEIEKKTGNKFNELTSGQVSTITNGIAYALLAYYLSKGNPYAVGASVIYAIAESVLRLTHDCYYDSCDDVAEDNWKPLVCASLPGKLASLCAEMYRHHFPKNED